MEWLSSPEAWIALATLTVLEIVLGIDNIIFISILCGRLPAGEQERARRLGLGFALVSRVLLLLSLSVIMRLTTPLFSVLGQDVSGRDLILLSGGLFLLGKATREIHHNLEGESEDEEGPGRKVAFWSVIAQIGVLDIVFSLDSVITAVGMSDDIPVMILAVVIAVGVMLFAAAPISRFVDEHPTVKMLALAFLILVGMSLIAEGFHHHVPKGYIYFAMGFSIGVEFLNLRARKKTDRKPVHLRGGPRHPDADHGVNELAPGA